MPLVPCRDCGREVGTHARLCPHCGTTAPIPMSMQYARVAKYVGIPLAVLTAFLLFLIYQL